MLVDAEGVLKPLGVLIGQLQGSATVLRVEAEAGHEIDGLVDPVEGGEYVQLIANFCGQLPQLLFGQEQVSRPGAICVVSQALALARVDQVLGDLGNMNRACGQPVHESVDEDEVRDSKVVELAARSAMVAMRTS